MILDTSSIYVHTRSTCHSSGSTFYKFKRKTFLLLIGLTSIAWISSLATRIHTSYLLWWFGRGVQGFLIYGGTRFIREHFHLTASLCWSKLLRNFKATRGLINSQNKTSDVISLFTFQSSCSCEPW